MKYFQKNTKDLYKHVKKGGGSYQNKWRIYQVIDSKMNMSFKTAPMTENIV